MLTIVHRTSSILFLERYIKKKEKDPIVKRETEPDSDGPVANKQTKIQDLLLGNGVGWRGLRMTESKAWYLKQGNLRAQKAEAGRPL